LQFARGGHRKLRLCGRPAPLLEEPPRKNSGQDVQL
jgi:hypothetical protein